MTDPRHRIATAPQTFDLERFRGLDKDGKEMWEKLAYCRSRAAVVSVIRERNLDPAMADGLPRHHPAALEALVGFSALGGKGRVLSEEHKARLQESRQKRPDRH